MIIETLTDHPELAVALGLLLRGLLAWQRELSWYEYRTLHGVKRLLFPTLERMAPGGFTSFVNAKGGRDDAEFLETRRATIRGTVRTLRQAGGSLHLLNSVKRRPSEHGDPLSRAHVVWTHDDAKQTECFIFSNTDGTVDVYSHHEDSVTDPVGHLTDKQTDGDPRGVVREALDRKS